jgi:hypothetical protein
MIKKETGICPSTAFFLSGQKIFQQTVVGAYVSILDGVCLALQPRSSRYLVFPEPSGFVYYENNERPRRSGEIHAD